MSRRSYAGGARQAVLDGAITSTSNTISCDSLDGWPTGSEGPGPFYALIDKGVEGSEEKVLCSARTGNSLTITTRGADGTTAVSHSLGATIEHIHAAVDSDEANDHVNSAQGVHGLDPGDPAVGETTAATLVNKTIDTSVNTITVAIGDVTGLSAQQAAQDAATALVQTNLDAEEAARISADSTLQGNIDAEEAARIAADAAHVAAGDPHPQYLTPTEANNAYLRLDTTNDPLTGQLALVGDPVAAEDATRKAYVDAADNLRLKLDGTTPMTGQLKLVGNPVAANDAARKQYVDNRTPFEIRGDIQSVTANASGAFAIAHGGGAIPLAAQCVQGNTGSFPVMFTGGAYDGTFVNFVAWRLDTSPPTKFVGNVTVSWMCLFAASG